MAGRDISAVELEGSSSWLAEELRGRQESGHNLGGRWHSRLSITKARPLQKASLWPFWLPYPTLPCPFSEDLDPCEPQMVRA